jgi:anti-sigma regulatory factor (Ser/Thr protein kinase)
MLVGFCVFRTSTLRLEALPPGMDNLRLSLRNRVDELRRLSESASAYLRPFELGEELEADVTLALEELFINIVRHGYPDGGEHSIHVEINVGGSAITMTVEDKGLPFNPMDVPLPDTILPIGERQVGGLGIHIIRSLTDSVSYEWSEGTNRTVMTKRRPRA